MKAKLSQPKPERFIPVVVTLETQHEVDALGALLNNLKLIQAAQTNGMLVCLRPFLTNGVFEIGMEIESVLLKSKSKRNYKNVEKS